VNSDRNDFLNVIRVTPARLDARETAWYLGFAVHDIPILVSAGLLKPLGHSPANAVKYYAVVTLAKLREDTAWLARATDAVVKHWQKKNACKTKAKNGHSSNASASFPIDQLQLH